MKATKTPGSKIVRLELSDDEWKVLDYAWSCAPSNKHLYLIQDEDCSRFFAVANNLVKAILYGGQEEIVG